MNTANVLYAKYVSGENFSAREQCLDFKRMEIECKIQGKILFTPGHTSDSISLKVDNIIFCGDAAMNGFPSPHRITIWMEDKIAFQKSWDILSTEEAGLIYPAHGKPFSNNDLKKYIDDISHVKLYKLK